MIGGYQILDLRGIDLTKGAVASNITDAYVLKQLLQLRDHIDKAYDFSKPLTNQLKPVLIRFRDKKNGEKTEGATFGELSVNGNYYTFKITARISGALVLTINVAFEEITNDYGNKEWVIDTATILLKDESKTITGDLELSGDLSVGDDASIGGDLSVTGKVNGKIAYEDIEDAQGHKRFIEDDIVFTSQIPSEGFTNVFGKWSLSGSHLILVFVMSMADTKTLGEFTVFSATINLPEWVYNKIYPIFGSQNNIVAEQTFQAYAINGLTQNLPVRLLKDSIVKQLQLQNTSALTLTSDKTIRIAFDLLIDNASE